MALTARSCGALAALCFAAGMVACGEDQPAVDLPVDGTTSTSATPQATGGADPAIVALTASLTGAAVTSGGDPDGSGNATIRIDLSKTAACFTIAVSGIEPATGAHIHTGGPGVAGPVFLGLDPPVSGTVSGCKSADEKVFEAIIENPADHYLQVHNRPYPGGALRGQLAKSA